MTNLIGLTVAMYNQQLAKIIRNEERESASRVRTSVCAKDKN